MTAPFCLLPKYADDLAEKVKSGELAPDVLIGMTSAERHAAFAEIVGEANATKVNASFESKLLLKDQQAGITRWIEKAKNLPPAVKRDLLARVERMDQVLQPGSGDRFLADLAKQRLGFGVTMEEAGHITELAQAVSAARQDMEAGGDRMAYGRARVAFGKYTSGLKNDVRQPWTPTLASGGRAVKGAANISKAVAATGDNSALFNQGWKTLFTNPGIWAKNAGQSFIDLGRQFGGKEVLDEVNAEIVSRPNSLNGRYSASGLALGNVEEAFPTSLPEKVPGLGRIFKASEAAYNAFQYRTRADLFDKYIEIAERTGEPAKDPAFLKEVGQLVNSLTGRGDLGRATGGADVVNSVLFSPRKLKSDLDFLLLQPFGGGGVGGSLNPRQMSFAQKIAIRNVVTALGAAGAMLALAHAVNPNAVELDPRSSDFGKIKIGDTRINVTGGLGALFTLAARIATWSSKSTVTGKVSKVNSGKFGGTTGSDLVVNFFENKLSPAASVVRDWLNQADREGQPVTIPGEAGKLVTPLPVSNAIELAKDPKAANMFLAMLADFLGANTNTYSNTKRKPQRKATAP